MDYHILEQDIENKSVQVVFHIPVPDGMNAVNVPWSEAIVQALSPSPHMSWNNEVENLQIVAGTVLEVVGDVRFSSRDLTNQQRLEEVVAGYNDSKDKLLADLSTRLAFFGHKGDV